MTTITLIQFPGSNCDADCIDAFKTHFDITLHLVWHKETKLPKSDALILPGGFSYGDYLRGGALASHSHIMPEVKAFATSGGPIIGICNGFQILTESHILPGVLLKNSHQKFVCQTTYLAPAKGNSGYHQRLTQAAYAIPVAHGEGRYFIDDEGLSKLQSEGQIMFRYGSPDGEVDPRFNPNGSVDNIAGIVSANGRVLGMMPHPERATMKQLGGSEDGRAVLKAFLESAL